MPTNQKFRSLVGTLKQACCLNSLLTRKSIIFLPGAGGDNKTVAQSSHLPGHSEVFAGLCEVHP